MSNFFGQVRNLVLPPASQQMRWLYSTYDMAAGPQEINLSYQQNRGDGLIPQSIIVNSTGITGSCQIIWDVGGLNFPLNIPANIQSSFTVPAVEGVKYSIIPASGTVGTLRIDLLNFPDIPANFIAQDTDTGQDVNVTNASVPVTNAAGTSLAVALQSGTASIGKVGLNAGTNVIGTANVQNVSGTTLAATASVKPATATLVSGSAAASGSTTIGTPTANSNLRKLVLSVTENATQATAGENTVTIALNGVTLFTESVYIPEVSLANNGVLYKRDMDFANIAFNTGSAGKLTATLETALETGTININAYFD